MWVFSVSNTISIKFVKHPKCMERVKIGSSRRSFQFVENDSTRRLMGIIEVCLNLALGLYVHRATLWSRFVTYLRPLVSGDYY